MWSHQPLLLSLQGDEDGLSGPWRRTTASRLRTRAGGTRSINRGDCAGLGGSQGQSGPVGQQRGCIAGSIKVLETTVTAHVYLTTVGEETSGAEAGDRA